MYGRDGMLAHPYMLGPNGESNGCVSLQDYSRFLEAFLRGEIDRLIVVPKLAEQPTLLMPLPQMTNSMPRNENRELFHQAVCVCVNQTTQPTIGCGYCFI